MKVVIEISKDQYNEYKNYPSFMNYAEQLIKNGTPLESVLDKMRDEIKEWYWQADKQALAKDPCVVDAMIDLFIRTIDKYKRDGEVEE